MKKLGLSLGLLVVLVVGTMAVVPRLIDWSTYRPDIAAAATQATGFETEVKGNIGLQLLPRPVARVTDISLNSNLDNRSLMSVEVATFHLSFPALLSGNLKFERLRLKGSRLHLKRDGAGKVNWQPQYRRSEFDGVTISIQRRLSVSRIEIENGSLLVQDELREFSAQTDEVDAIVVVDGFTGPIAASGNFIYRETPLKFEFHTRRHGRDGRVPIPHATLEFADDDSGALKFSGSLTALAPEALLSGRLNAKSRDIGRLLATLADEPRPVAGRPVPVDFTSRLLVRDGVLVINDIDLRLDGLKVSGAVNVDTTRQARFDAAFSAGRIDLSGQSISMDDATSLFSRILRVAKTAIFSQGIAGSVDVEVDGITIRDGILRQARMTLALDAGHLVLENMSALLPGGSELVISGAAGQGDGWPNFSGYVELTSKNLSRLINWTGPHNAQGFASHLGPASLFGDLILTPELVTVQNAALQLNGSSARAGLTYRLQKRPSFGLDLDIDRLNLDAYLTGPVVAGARPVSIGRLPMKMLDRFDANLRLKVGRLTYNGKPFDSAAMDARLINGRLTVQKARLRTPSNTQAILSGSAHGFSNGPEFDAELRLAGPDPSALSKVFGREIALLAQSSEPLSLLVRLKGTEARTEFSVKGKIIGAQVGIAGQVLNLAQNASVDAKLALLHSDVLRLLSARPRTRVAGLPRPWPTTITGTIGGNAKSLSLDIDAGLINGDAGLKGTITDIGGTPVVDLNFVAAHGDLRQLIPRHELADKDDRAESLPFSVSGRIHGTEQRLLLSSLVAKLGATTISGIAEASTRKQKRLIKAQIDADQFDLAAISETFRRTKIRSSNHVEKRPHSMRISELPTNLEIDVILAAKRMDYGETYLDDTKGKVNWKRGVLKLADFEGRLFGGKISASGRIVDTDPPSFNLDVAIGETEFEALVRSTFGTEAIGGRLSLSANLNDDGAGFPSAGEHVVGRVSAIVEDGHLSGLGLGALPLSGSGANDFASIDAGVRRAIAANRLPFSKAQGNWSIRDNVARTDDTNIRFEGGNVGLSGELNLKNREIDFRNEVRFDAYPGAPPIVIRLRGIGENIERETQAEAFARYVLGTTRGPNPAAQDRAK